MIVGKTKDGFDAFAFHTGDCTDAYRYFGAHLLDDTTAVFRVYAPSALGVTLLLEGRAPVPMMRVGDGCVWETTASHVRDGLPYELEVRAYDGSARRHVDPYGFGMDLRPRHRSIVRSLWYEWGDGEWLAARAAAADALGRPPLDVPLNMYEVNLASWRRKGPGRTDWYRYDEVADQLIGHVTDAGYNCVEFMPLSEHPLDESWGYQNTGFFSPTSRFGTACELKRLVDRLHQANVACVMDFVPVHFASDAYGLADFDGTKLYEYPSPELGVSEWGSHNFMLTRGDVQSFVASAARWWLEEFHFDGLRMDAVSRLLYWQGDPSRGVNEGSVDFVRRLNAALHRAVPGCTLIAEDSSTFPQVTGDPDRGGLGFDYKWDMGWVNDTTDFFRKQDFERREHYGDLLFSMHYFPSEHWVLPLSHDENVYGKSTLPGKCFGPWARKFRSARAFYLYMACHPGKKLNFMGSEWGQLREWDARRLQDWDLMDPQRAPEVARETPGAGEESLSGDPATHLEFYRFMSELNRLYLDTPALWRWDFRGEGFTWLGIGDRARERLVFAFERRWGQERYACVLNLGEPAQRGFGLAVSFATSLELVLSTDWERFGGRSEDGCVDVEGERFVGPEAPTAPASAAVGEKDAELPAAVSPARGDAGASEGVGDPGAGAAREGEGLRPASVPVVDGWATLSVPGDTGLLFRIR